MLTKNFVTSFKVFFDKLILSFYVISGQNIIQNLNNLVPRAFP